VIQKNREAIQIEPAKHANSPAILAGIQKIEPPRTPRKCGEI
jgi:hypothetical protein